MDPKHEGCVAQERSPGFGSLGAQPSGRGLVWLAPTSASALECRQLPFGCGGPLWVYYPGRDELSPKGLGELSKSLGGLSCPLRPQLARRQDLSAGCSRAEVSLLGHSPRARPSLPTTAHREPILTCLVP